jgi:fatty acid desaturase
MVGFIVAVFALYRSVIFVHELVHLRKKDFELYRIIWNLIAGLPLMVPSFTYYGVHGDHHKKDLYGTDKDGEYVAFGIGHPFKIIGYVFLSFILPAVFLARFALLAPLSWVFPPLRKIIWQGASSLTIDLNYKRPPATKRDGKYWWLQEIGACLYAWTAIVLIYLQILPVKFLILWYAVALAIFIMNSFRTLGAHAYLNEADNIMSIREQFVDSVDVKGGLLTALWAPVGLRFHATHHLFPNMPYHNLGKAHRRLTNELSDNRLYVAATRRSFFHAMQLLWADAKEHQAKLKSEIKSENLEKSPKKFKT